MVREFSLLNELGQEYSLMDIERYCLLTEPSGLGITYKNNYQELGNIFIQNSSQVKQSQIGGTLNFANYKNFNSFGNFIKTSKSLKIKYKIPFDNNHIEFLKDVVLSSLSKTEVQQNGFLSESIIFDCLSSWYQNKETVYTIAKLEQEIQWDFRWDARFADYSERSIVFDNDGHTEASFTLEMLGYLINPGFSITQNGEVINSLNFNMTLQQGESLLYSSRDNDIYIKKKNTNGTFTNLFTQNYVDINNNNVFKIPQGTSTISLTADNDIYNAKLNIYKQFEVV